MKKHASRKKAKTPRVKINNTKRYLQFYLLAIVTGTLVFIGGSLMNPQASCANAKTCQSDLTEQIDNHATGTFQGHTITPPKIDLAHDFGNTSVLGTSVPEGEKHIYVDLSTQKLFAYQGANKIMDTYIASGKWNPTPVGNFHIWEKLRATRMAGGSGTDAYNLPNVPYVMYFYQDYGLHGAYWHNNFGHMMSHGCVNMRIVDARDLYNWADVGTPVSVCNSFTEPNTCIQN